MPPRGQPGAPRRRTKKRYRGLDQAPKYVSPTLPYQLGPDYGCKTGQPVSILTLEGRVLVPDPGDERPVALLHQGAPSGAAKRWYDQPPKPFDRLVSLERALPDPSPETQQRSVGVDVGQRSLAVATDPQNHRRCFPGQAVRALADHYARRRKRLPPNGPRAAPRRLVGLARRERRLKHERTHVSRRQLVDASPHRRLGLEDLTHLRERRQRQHGKQARVKQRKAKGQAAQWAVAALPGFVAYQALLTGSMAVQVDASQTSQAGPRCGSTAEDHRPDKGRLFRCQACHRVLHADWGGARQVALRTLLARQDWVRTGVLSDRPDGSDEEAKAGQRRRYAELRWSPDTSPRAFAGGI